MMRLNAQPHAHRFGNALKNHLLSGRWDRFSAAVAWVRRSGVSHLESSLKAFLNGGGVVRITSGIDIENTSIEGLADLLVLEEEGDFQLFVYHNESPTTIFHPKLYLFENETTAMIITGSNNITQSGLYTNVEAALELEIEAGSSLIRQAQNLLEIWQDTDSGFARRVSSELLDQLEERGYIQSEASLRRRRNLARSEQERAGDRQHLFRNQETQAPVPPAPPPGRLGPQSIEYTAGQVLLMRVRTARGTQVQFPMRLVQRSVFFAGQDSIRSSADGRNHAFHYAHVGGRRNTLKVEIPETADLNDPVLRIEKQEGGLVYEAFDATSPTGRQIMKILEEGRVNGDTFMTLPNDPERSTWARFV